MVLRVSAFRSAEIGPRRCHTTTTLLAVGRHHNVQGIECDEIPMVLPSLGKVIVLEATAQSQEVLVNMALEEPDDTTKQITENLNEGDPYGAVLWPAAYAVASKILTTASYRSYLPQQKVLELGAGTGLVSMALALAGAKHVIATDYEKIPLQILQYAAQNLNHPLDASSIEYQLLDMRDNATPLPEADIVVAADIMYEPQTGIAMARRAVEALKRGSKVLVGDSPGRPGRAAFLEELQNLGVLGAKFDDTIGYTCSGPRHELICGKGSTSVSDEPQQLMVAVMELDPAINLPTKQ